MTGTIIWVVFRHCIHYNECEAPWKFIKKGNLILQFNGNKENNKICTEKVSRRRDLGLMRDKVKWTVLQKGTVACWLHRRHIIVDPF